MGDTVGTLEHEAPDEAPPPQRRRRRWPFVVVGVVLIAVLLPAALWNWWVPHYRPALGDGERYGVDVSHHQGAIDWERVAADDISFAYIKATEGGDFLDTSFATNWQGAGDAGLDRGAYHFFTLCRPGLDQAEFFLETVPSDADALPPAVDLELAGNCADRPSRATVAHELDVFIDTVEAATAQAVVLYIGPDFENEYNLAADLDGPLWHRRLFLHPDVPQWWIWQFHAWASVAGIDGGADLNVMRGQPSAR